MATRNDFDDFFGDDDDAPVTDTRADGRLYRVPLTRLSPNLVNPRTDFGTEDALIDFGKSLARRQNQACPVVSRNAYLKLWPDHRDQVRDVDYILVSGERRFRAASMVGMLALNCIVDDNVAADRKTFMEAVVSENVDRQNFDAIEEAYAVQALVAEFGSNRDVAQHFERVDGWVTQRVLLTHLAPEVQDLVRRKSLPLEPARALGKLARDKSWDAREQLQWWEEEQGRRSAASAARVAARKAGQAPAAPAAAPEPLTAPAQPAASAPAAAPPETTREPEEEPRSFTAVKLDRPDNAPKAVTEAPASARLELVPALPAAEVIPEPRTHQTEEPDRTAESQPKRLPYDDGNFIAQHLILKMPEGELMKVRRLLNEHAAQHGLEDLAPSTV